MRRVVFFLVLCACPPPSSDAEAQAVARDLDALDDAAETTMRVTPNETGLANVEVYVKSREKSLHEHILNLQNATLSASTSATLQAAYAKNATTAHVVQDRVNNAVPKESPAARARAKKVALEICEITETPKYATECAPFRTPETE
ncbi:MAG TPA: hypothetical protein VGH87_02740 [Polyangiaceae bacterium]